MPKTIEITVAPGGEVSIEAIGFTGKACLAATRAYEDAIMALGGQVESVVAKAEMTAKSPVINRTTQTIQGKPGA